MNINPKALTGIIAFFPPTMYTYALDINPKAHGGRGSVLYTVTLRRWELVNVRPPPTLEIYMPCTPDTTPPDAESWKGVMELTIPPTFEVPEDQCDDETTRVTIPFETLKQMKDASIAINDTVQLIASGKELSPS